MSKALRTGYKNPDSLPHVVVARKIQERTGAPPVSGERVPDVFIRDAMNPAGSDDVAQIGSRIKAINRLIEWWDKCPPCLQYESPPVPPKEELEKEIKNLRKQLGDIQRQRRG
jgi:hypothetical protein